MYIYIYMYMHICKHRYLSLYIYIYAYIYIYRKKGCEWTMHVCGRRPKLHSRQNFSGVEIQVMPFADRLNRKVDGFMGPSCRMLKGSRGSGETGNREREMPASSWQLDSAPEAVVSSSCTFNYTILYYTILYYTILYYNSEIRCPTSGVRLRLTWISLKAIDYNLGEL